MPPVPSPLQGTIVSIEVQAGDAVHAGAPLLVMESMKMEHVVHADHAGVVRSIDVAVGQTVYPGDPLADVEEADVGIAALGASAAAVDLDFVRPDLADVLERHAFGHDDRRPDAVARRR